MNTQTKHTPGPWHIGMKPGPMVYGPQGEQVVGINVMLDIDEVTANARFIAAAPAMYEALQDAYGKLCYLAPDKFDDEEHAANWQRDLSTMLAALTQAEGRG